MKVSNHTVTGNVFELVKTVELDISLGDESAWTTRIELFRDTEQSNLYRCHVWELELFQLTPSFPRNAENVPVHITDDMIMVKRGIAHSNIASISNEPFDAPDIDAALERVIEDLKKFLELTAGM